MLQTIRNTFGSIPAQLRWTFILVMVVAVFLVVFVLTQFIGKNVSIILIGLLFAITIGAIVFLSMRLIKMIPEPKKFFVFLITFFLVGSFANNFNVSAQEAQEPIIIDRLTKQDIQNSEASIKAEMNAKISELNTKIDAFQKQLEERQALESSNAYLIIGMASLQTFFFLLSVLFWRFTSYKKTVPQPSQAYNNSKYSLRRG